MLCIEMIIEDSQEFDFYYSEKAEKEGRGKNTINGQVYVERIRKDRKPKLSSRYNDLIKIATCSLLDIYNEKVKIERI